MGRIGLFFILIIAALVAGFCSFMDADDPRLADGTVASEQLVQRSLQSPFVAIVCVALVIAAAYVGWTIYRDGKAPKPTGRVGQ